jgi:hypothetical protein
VPTPEFDRADFDNEKDDLFETHLKQFRPLPAEPLRVETLRPATRHSLAPAVWAAGAAALILIALVVAFQPRTALAPATPRGVESGEQFADSQPLTIGSANALLTHAPSVEAALDRARFHSPSTQLAKGKQSALAVLSEYKDKL